MRESEPILDLKLWKKKSGKTVYWRPRTRLHVIASLLLAFIVTALISATVASIPYLVRGFRAKTVSTLAYYEYIGH